jgi:large subunit ribosomal protein L17
MRHRVAHRKLGRTSEHRTSLLRNLAASLIANGRIRTTEAKAKELRPFVEKLVTLGKRDSLHARRRALSILPRRDVVQKLFGEVSPRFSERPGGYTRILKLAHRQGDGASMAFIEFVDFKFEGAQSAPAPAPAKAKSEKSEKSAPDSSDKSAKPDKAEKKAKAKTTAAKKVADAEPSEEDAGEEKPATKKRATRKKKTDE